MFTACIRNIVRHSHTLKKFLALLLHQLALCTDSTYLTPWHCTVVVHRHPWYLSSRPIHSTWPQFCCPSQSMDRDFWVTSSGENKPDVTMFSSSRVSCTQCNGAHFLAMWSLQVMFNARQKVSLHTRPDHVLFLTVCIRIFILHNLEIMLTTWYFVGKCMACAIMCNAILLCLKKKNIFKRFQITNIQHTRKFPSKNIHAIFMKIDWSYITMYINPCHI